MKISTAPYLAKILRAQGSHKRDINNNIIIITHTNTHKAFKNYMLQKYTYQKAKNQTIGASFSLSLSLSLPQPWCNPLWLSGFKAPTLSLPTCSQSHTCAGHMQVHRGKSRVSIQRISKSLVHRISGIVWFLVEFWTGILFEHGVQSKGIYSKQQGWDERKHAALESFSFVLKSERCGCQQKNAVNGKGHEGEEDRQVQWGSIWGNSIAQGRIFVIDSLT